MNERDPGFPPASPALGDKPAERSCLRCGAAFWSEGFGERICKRCKARVSWKTASSSSNGANRRRAGK